MASSQPKPSFLPSVRVHMLPALFEPQELAGGAAVIIDVLRASTTIVQALAAGARRVIPCATIEEAQARAAALLPESALLGGERGGVRIAGFDLDNSPRAYTADVVRDRTIIFTTTNGTAALRRAVQAQHVLIGALANLTAVERQLRRLQRPVHLVCAGTDGRLTAEDILLAGLLAARLLGEAGHPSMSVRSLDVPTEMAIEFAARRGETPDAIRRTLRESLGGRNLIALGYDADIDWAAQVDRYDAVPQFEAAPGELRLSDLPDR